ncbi:MAG: BamA/TamA family outer membrane protein, partial [Pseudomonadota bacterium]|nr:BamA/TamA family outer membrane protein [Pseudomonadota bacterium]
LLNTDLFRDIRICPQTAKGERVPVRINLESVPRYRLRPGIGFGTDTGARVSLDYRVLNLFKKAHELQGKLLLAEREQSLLTTYIIPDLRRRDSRFLLGGGFEREDTDSFLSREFYTEAEYQRSFNKKLSGSVFMHLSQEYSLIGGDETNAQMLLSGVRFSWIDIDDPLHSRQGTQIKFEFQGAEETFLSDTSFIQLSGQVTKLLPLPWESSLLLRLKGGTTWHPDPLHNIPASLRFFAGGDHSVRGYAYKSLGPENEDGDVVGGKHLLVANIELEKHLHLNWGVAVFYDIGNAFNDFADYDLAQGAGLGVRYYSLIGTIRFDVARRIDSEKNKFRLHLGVGW